MRPSRIAGLVASVVGVTATAAVLHANVTFFTADDRANLINPTTVVVTGSIQCDPSDTFTVFVDVVQEQADGAIAAGGIDETACTGTLQQWVATAVMQFPANGQLKKGPATILAQASTSDGAGGSDSAIVTLKGHLSR